MKLPVGSLPQLPERFAAAASPSESKERKGEYGFQVTDLTPDVARQFNVKDTAGVIVVGVAPNSKADAAGVKKGDIIVEMAQQPVHRAQDVHRIASEVTPGARIPLTVWRASRKFRLVVGV